MHDRDESIPAAIPRFDPAFWEDHEGFRETFLLYFADRAQHVQNEQEGPHARSLPARSTDLDALRYWAGPCDSSECCSS